MNEARTHQNTTLSDNLLFQILFQNRQRCCICRNPELPVEIHTINKSNPTLAPDKLVALRADCYQRAMDCEGEFGTEYLSIELARYKQIWEQECRAWRDGPNYILRIRQGDRIRDIQLCQYDEEDGAFVGWYELDEGGEMLIDMRSDELVRIDIRKGLYDSGGYGDRSYIACHSAYEFDLGFTAAKAGWYALLIQNKSSEKATVDLNVSTFLSVAREQESAVQELIAQATSYRAQELERLSSGVSTGYIPWKILPPGEHPFPEIEKYYEDLQTRKRNVRYELERLQRISTLEPTKTYCGIDEFEGYVLFYFQEFNIAVLDCPIVGNAIYLLRGDWEGLSRLSKNELLKHHAKNVTRIVHSGDWFFRLRRIILERRSA